MSSQGPYKRELEGDATGKEVGHVMTELRGWSDVRTGPQAKECRHLWKLEKIMKRILP